MQNTISSKIVIGVSWSMVETATQYIIRFGVGIILARLLSPADFGLIGIILIFISVSDVFVNAGFGQAYIQKKNTTDLDSSTIFVINLFLGLCSYLIIYITAPFISSYFNEPQLIDLIRALSLVIIITSLNVIQIAIIRKNFQFKKKSIITFVASIISGVISIFCAYLGYGVWSLVVQHISSAIIICVLLYTTSTWKPNFRFSFNLARSLFSFGGWILLANITLSFFNNFYRLAIGKLFSASDLGYYERGRQFENMITQTVTTVFGRVAFPVFSKLQDDRQQLKASLTNFIVYSSAIVFPLLVCCIITARPVILFLLTEKWMMAIPYMQLLCAVGFMVPIYYYIGPLLQAVGEARKAFFYTAIISALRIINVIVCFRWEIHGIIIGEFFVTLFTTVIMSELMKDSIGFSYISVIVKLRWIILYSLVSGFVGYTFLQFLQVFPLFFQIMVPSVIVIMIYSVGLCVSDCQFYKYKSILNKFNSKNNK